MYSYALPHLLAMAGGTVHAAPADPLTIQQAHQAMRTHIGCRAAHCPCKYAALQTLVEAGRIKPDYDHYDERDR